MQISHPFSVTGTNTTTLGGHTQINNTLAVGNFATTLGGTLEVTGVAGYTGTYPFPYTTGATMPGALRAGNQFASVSFVDSLIWAIAGDEG